MKYLAAYCLLALSGKTDISNDNNIVFNQAIASANDLNAVLKSVGVDPVAENVNAVIAALAGKNLDEVVRSGLSKVGSLSVGGGSSAPAGNAGAGKTQAAAPVEEKKAAPVEEEDVDMDAGGLFGDDF